MLYRSAPGGDSAWHQAPDTAWAAYAATVCTEAERSEDGESADDPAS